MTIKAPRRAFHLTLELGADTLPELASALMNLSLRADRGELTRGVSGGPDSSYIYDLLQNPEQTHEAYFVKVHEYLARKQAEQDGQTESAKLITHCPWCGSPVSVADEPYCANADCRWNNGGTEPDLPCTCDDGCNGCDDCTDYEDDVIVCERCNGDGTDPMCDGLLPCPVCQGEQKP